MNGKRMTALAAAVLLGTALAVKTVQVSGTVVDARGKPIAGAEVWVQPALTTGLIRTRTDAKGRYSAQVLSTLPYTVKAWYEVNFEGQRYCLRLGMPKPTDFDAFTPDRPVVRNFRAQSSGVIEDLKRHDGYFGAEVRLMSGGEGVPYDSELILTFEPQGPLADGSRGKTLTRRVRLAEGGMVYDLPLGRYEVSGTYVVGGQRRTLRLGSSYEAAPAAKATLSFKSNGSCSNNNGIERAFLYYSGAAGSGAH
ncbi:hypothetical protein HNR42_000241 [Deinobacterium chartae]|uniref:Carboxypeptidase regulatory-like domain-containing protein n=1 Tax=Deinobacterium chartae TaxID=521158 RepID=A0A841HX57_9DEIO|nr:carboxypeptidase-like regulatory domain-containing protein [Deinobacterium chartae]MBB6096829.1 hypothetical protein [Deinobacterium chartae]